MNTVDMTFTHNGSIFTFSADMADHDKNGNLRIDIQVVKDGFQYRESIKGFRKVKNGYRTQLGAHAYSYQEAIQDLFEAIKVLEPVKKEKVYEDEPRKSSSKEAVKLIRGYIKDNIDSEDISKVSEKLLRVANGFTHWYGPHEKRRTPNLQDAFRSWLQCMPSEIYVTPYDQEQSELLCDWMNTHGRSYSTEAINHMFYALLYREFNKLCSIYGVKPIPKRVL